MHVHVLIEEWSQLSEILFIKTLPYLQFAISAQLLISGILFNLVYLSINVDLSILDLGILVCNQPFRLIDSGICESSELFISSIQGLPSRIFIDSQNTDQNSQILIRIADFEVNGWLTEFLGAAYHLHSGNAFIHAMYASTFVYCILIVPTCNYSEYTSFQIF